MNNYMVVICGYEGMNAVFGPFSKEEAYELYLELRNCSFPVGPETTIEDEHSHWTTCENSSSPYCKYCQIMNPYYDELDVIEEKYGIYYRFKPEQVCIMKGSGKKPIKCACDVFPDRPGIERTWFY